MAPSEYLSRKMFFSNFLWFIKYYWVRNKDESGLKVFQKCPSDMLGIQERLLGHTNQCQTSNMLGEAWTKMKVSEVNNWGLKTSVTLEIMSILDCDFREVNV